VPTLERLRTDHAEALLAFERANREYFARSIPDRGDAFFAEFDAMLHDRLAEQEDGVCHFHVLVDEGGEVVGRINLVDVEEGCATLGYRIAEHATGRGLATAAVADLCRLAAAEYGLRAITAVATRDNGASRTVLERNGFTAVAETTIDARPATRYRRDLSTPTAPEQGRPPRA
jgi:ribosomal-protein-alanine N-acetyltransferase